MLGELLEFSVAAEALGPAVEFYRKLGFREAATGSIVQEPYVPLSLAAITIGLRGAAGHEDPVPSFVRPNLKDHLRAFKHLDLVLEFAETADDQFHRAGFKDPNGLLVVLLEARTCAPTTPDSRIVSPLGEFLEYSLPTHSIAESTRFWDKLGLRRIAGGETPQPWCRVQGRGLTLGFYAGYRFRPGLSFVCDNAAARLAYLEVNGCRVARNPSFALPAREIVTLSAPTHPIYLAVPASA